MWDELNQLDSLTLQVKPGQDELTRNPPPTTLFFSYNFFCKFFLIII